MVTQHTPGPWHGQGPDGKFPDSDWRADNDAARRTTCAPIVAANGETVALVVRTDWNDAQIEADARLVAAAPELLAALRTCEQYIDEDGRRPGMRAAADAFLAHVRAAIAKATGSAA